MVTEKEKIVFIVNPVSGTGKRDNALNLIREKLSDRYDYKIVTTKFPGEATEIVNAYHKQGYTKVIAVGGDGTVNEVAKAVAGTALEMGILPTGSGNGLARHLHIPMNITKAIEVINNGNVINIDNGLINNHVFFCTSGVGFDALIGNRFAEASTRGLSTYAKVTIKEYFNYKEQQYTIAVNGQTLERSAFMVTFANASQYGNNAYIAPKADTSDGMMDIVIVRKFPLYIAPIFAIRMFTKLITGSKYVETIRAKEAILYRKEAGYLHYDGEPGSMGAELKVSIVHASVRMMVP